MKIGKHNVTQKSPTFIIAEIGNNHNGSLERTLRMIDAAIDAGVDCVKFQMRHMDQVYRKKSLDMTDNDLNAEYTIDLLKRFELSIDDHKKIFDYCQKKQVTYLCTPWDLASLEILVSFGVEAFKVASADLTNIPLLASMSKTRKPMILSTGMSFPDEIKKTAEYLNKQNAEFALLHCNSTYPAPFHDIQLSYLATLLKIHPLVGYSGHERGTAVSIAAVALGARIIERHFTFDRTMEGPDHAASLEPKDFKLLVEGIRQVESALGDSGDKKISQGELINRENLGKSLIASKSFKKGHVLGASDIKVRSPGQGLSPQYFEELVGKTLNRDIVEEDFFFRSDLQGSLTKAKQYQFNRPWGVPVRYHDFSKFTKWIQPDLFEFHLSYSDMDLKISDYLQGIYDYELVVHAPELFQGSRLMDLASPDEEYRKFSVRETQRVVAVTRELKKYFPKTKRPMIVANIGGFTMDEPLRRDVLPQYYDRFAQSLKELDLEGVELTPQSMAPFPWHFGGQRHQNIFVRPDDIIYACDRFKLRICFDVSHSFLTSNHFKYDFYKFVHDVAPYIAHLHLGDAKGLNGEGLQVGDGDMDFKRLGSILKERCSNAWFIPEIWQGHKDEGVGFWVALERLMTFDSFRK